MRLRSRQSQRGVAIVTALLLTTLAVTIVGSLFWQQQVQVRSIENQRMQLQKQWILRGALDWAQLILRADGAMTAEDHLGEPWAVPLAETRLDEYVDNPRANPEASDAVLSGSIVDAQSRFNLNNLAANGTINPQELAAFRRLLVNLGLNAGLAQAAADLVAAGQRAPGGQGAAGGQQAAGGAQMRVEHVDDLLAAPGFTPDIVARLSEFVVVLPDLRAINVNTAPAEVLSARIERLSMSDAAALVAARENAWFRSTNEFVDRLRQMGMGGAAVQHIDVRTEYFLINGHVRMSRAAMDMQALIRRPGRAEPSLIWIREY
ncbi:MAG TPA: type II secretion system minor pseudopilin GspK [Noviherbaspirillum sp.]|nr:type II secretion system minor pseudopilin GspK [Noviherbaspirillum sp.]